MIAKLFSFSSLSLSLFVLSSRKKARAHQPRVSSRKSGEVTRLIFPVLPKELF